MKIIRSLCLKNQKNKTVKKIKIIYDISLDKQKIQIIEFYRGKRKKKESVKLYTLKDIESIILDKIRTGYQVYATPKEKNISFEDFQKEIKHMFDRPRSPHLNSNTKSHKKKKTSINHVEEMINSYNKKDLLAEIKKYNSNSNKKTHKLSKKL